jgi:hypothetical protein
VRGAIHVHTTVSDGGGTPAEVAAAARAAGLQFVVITDHNTVDAKAFEGYHDGVLVMVGTEASTTGGHILGLGVSDPAYRFSGDPLDVLEDIRDLGGIAFAAHPASARSDFRYTAWDLPGPWGMEVLNGDSQARAAGWLRLLRAAALYGLNARYALLGSLTPPTEELARWDALLARRNVPAIAGADAHARIPLRKDAALPVPSYEAMLGLMANYVLLEAPLTGDAARDAAAILEALGRGRSYVGVDALAPAGGFYFVAEAGGERWTMGDTVPPREGLRLRAGGALPADSQVQILKDGRPGRDAEGTVSGPGVYRAEVHVHGAITPWILSNPIYVFDGAAQEVRARAGAWPPVPPAPAPAEVVDGFEGTTVFGGGRDPRSSLDRDLHPTGGIDGKGAMRLTFRLGHPTPDHPHTYVALVNQKDRDLTGRQGIVLAVKADGVYRFHLQVRDANPASTDEGTEWWFASVRTSAEWRRVAVPFARMRSINPRTDGRLDLDKVRALVIVIDKGAEKPGTGGTIWLDEVGVY